MNRLFLLAFLGLVISGVSCSKRDSLNETGPDGKDVVPIKLVLESSASVTLGFGETALIRVRALYLDDQPAANAQVDFAIVGTAGGSSLLVGAARAGTDGRVQNQVAAGADKTTYDVVISAAGATAIKVRVQVDGIYEGGLRVRFTYAGLVTLGDIITRVHASAPCATLDLGNPPVVLAQTIANLVTAPQPTFQGLTEGLTYTVTATALGPTGQPVALGCVVSPPIVGRSTVQATVALSLMPESLVGTYDFGTRLHADEALPGQIGAVINELNGFFLDPANTLADYLVYYAVDLTGGDPTNPTELAEMEDDLGDAWTIFAVAFLGINDPDVDNDGKRLDDAVQLALLDQAPAWVETGLTAGGDITELVKNLTVGGKLHVTSVDGQGNFAGDWGWGDFVLQWRYGQGCALNDTCCGKRRFTASELGLAAVGADFTGTAVLRNVPGKIEYDFDVPAHKVELQIGNILLVGIEQLVLPPLTGENTLEGAAEAMFGCAAYPTETDPVICGCVRAGAWIDDNLGLGQPGLGEQLCHAAIDAAVGALEQQLLAITWNGSEDSYLMMSIDAILSDSDLDLQTDKLVGATAGTLYVDLDTAAFSGDITAELEAELCAADGDCAAYAACRPRQDVLDPCEGRLVCGLAVGSRIAGQTCTADNQCRSGTCLPAATGVPRTCLTVCEVSGDCGAGLSCVDDGATVTIATGRTMTVDACGP